MVKSPLVDGAVSYSLQAEGGYDPDYWGYNIKQTVLSSYDVTTDSLYQAGMGAPPETELWFFVSGGAGPADSAETSFDYYEGRFGSDWVWSVVVNN